MAWTAPKTDFSPGNVLTAAQMNAIGNNLLAIRNPQDNLVQAFKTDVFTSTGTHTTFQDITGLSVTITPTETSSKVLVLATFNLSSSVGSATHMTSRLMRGTTPLGVPGAGSNPATAAISLQSNGYLGNLSIMYLDSPATTSATTYKIQGASTNNNTWYCNQRGDGATVQSSSITVMEIPV